MSKNRRSRPIVLLDFDLEFEYEKEMNSNSFLILLNQKVIGTIRYRKTDIGYKIERFAILKEYQHKGYGIALFNKMVSVAKEKNMKEIMLEVKEHNYQAIKFYQHQEFEQISIRNNYYQDGSNALIMKKVI